MRSFLYYYAQQSNCKNIQVCKRSETIFNILCKSIDNVFKFNNSSFLFSNKDIKRLCTFLTYNNISSWKLPMIMWKDIYR